MKELKKLLVLPFVASMLLIGCKNNNVEPTPEPEPEPEKTITEVVTDINTAFSAVGIDELLSWHDEYSCYIGGLNLGAAEHATDEQHAAELQNATEFVVSYLPEYLTQNESLFEEEQDDYYIGLSVDKVGVDTFGYINESNIIVQIQVASIAE